MLPKRIVISGIDTNIGKTVVSAILAEAIGASYWKPIQAGDLHQSDSMCVAALTESVTILPEAVRLKKPASPHFAAKEEGIHLNEELFQIPDVPGALIIEGAGGLMVPINEQGFLFANLFKTWNVPVIVVSRHYLGSINHTLLTLSTLRSLEIPVEGIIYIGAEHEPSESIIETYSGIPTITHIPQCEVVDKAFVMHEAGRVRHLLNPRNVASGS